MTRITHIVSAAAVAAALLAPASGAFAATKTQNALIGAAVGALAGSLLGHGDTTAVVAGAAVGGIVGASTGRDNHGQGVRDYGSVGRSYQVQPTRYRDDRRWDDDRRYEGRRWDAPAYRTDDRAPAYRDDRGDYTPVAYRPYGY